MKIVFCYPTISDGCTKTRDIGLAPHMSLLCLATHLKKVIPDVKVKIIDGNHYSIKETIDQIIAFSPDVVGMSVDFTNYENAVLIANRVKMVSKDIKIGLGSNHASNMYKQILSNQPCIDFIVRNDGEEAIEQYVRFIMGQDDITEVPNICFRGSSGIEVNKLKIYHDLDFSAPDYSLVDIGKYFDQQEKVFGQGYRMMQFTSQRGCANKPLCVFCGRYGDGMRFRNPDLCAKDMADIAERYQLTEVWDRSDSFVQDHEWFKAFARSINKYTDRFSNGQATFKTYARGDQLLDTEVVDYIRKLNFRILFIGYEAGDDTILKNINKNANTSTYYQATQNVLSRGIQVDASFIVGLPGENKQTLKNHIEFVKNLVKMGLRKIRVNRLLVLPGTPLYKKVTEKYPDLAKTDTLNMPELQYKLFETDFYDLSDFGGKVENFMDALTETASEMVQIVESAGGSTEGYGHNKGLVLNKGKEIS